MVKKIINIVIAITLLTSIVFAGIQSYRVSTLSRSVEQYRYNIELARRANDRYAVAFGEAKATNTELGECLSEHISTLSQLRSQLQEVRARYERMQEILESLSDLGTISDDSDDYTSGGDD